MSAMTFFYRGLLQLIRYGSNAATLLSVRLVRWTGKHSEAIHPKHLIHHPMAMWFVPHVEPGDRVLDIGTGTGTQAVKTTRAGAWAVGVELNTVNLRIARSLCKGTGVALVRGDATRPLPFRDESFTAVLALNVLEHFVDPIAVLKECGRVLKPGGWVAISLPNRDTKWKRRYRKAGLPWMDDRDHKHEYTWPEVVELVEAAGLQIRSGPDAIVIDTPLKGLFDLVGGVSLRLYSRLVDWRVRQAAQKPQESVGFRCTAAKP